MSKEKWNRRYAEKELLWPEDPSPVLAEEIGDLPPGRVLDLAAGEGRNSIYLARQGWQVRAVDFAEVAVEKGRDLAARTGLSVEWETADLVEYRPPRERFDLVMIFYLHMPWGELKKVFTRAAEAVRPGGIFLLVGHDRSNLGRGAGGPQDPDVLYSADDVVPLLEGFTVDKALSFERPVEHEHTVEAPDKNAVDCLVRARKK